MRLSSTYLGTIDTNIQTFSLDSWKRMQMSGSLVWDKLMEVKQSATLTEVYYSIVESARIRSQGQGGNHRLDDMVAKAFSITNEDSGDALTLTVNEIEDNRLAAGPGAGMPALDFAGNWARQMGGNLAYWPQQKLFELIAAGKTGTGLYDDTVFFSTSHPINPTGSGGTYSNLISAKPLGGATSLDTAAANLASVIASMRSLKQANGLQRFLRPKYLVADPSLQYRVDTLLGARFVGATDNVAFTSMGIEGIICDELAGEPGVWYLVAESVPGEGAPFIFQERKPYELNTFSHLSSAELSNKKVFEWHFDGRNAATYGLPFMIFRVEPA